MAKKISERFVWAVETLAVDPDDRLLEIGCGHGVAVSLICEKLAGGTITAIDRSEKMIEVARKRNREHVSSGKATFKAIPLDRADFGDERFDKIFAINVALKRPARELAVIRESLAPGGAVYLFHQPPVQRKTREIADELTGVLRDNGFRVRQVLFEDLEPVTCIIAEA